MLPKMNISKTDLPASKILPKETWIGWISSLTEAYSMAIYSFTAPFIATLIFKQATTWEAVFFSYVLAFIASCFLYPAGAAYYGFLGDKHGRQKACIYSTLGLGIATALMGLVPIDFLGNKAWIAFLFLICAQNFFSGGEYHGSIVFSLEHAENQKSGLMSSISCLFAVFGLLLANGLATVSWMTQNELWLRACFLIGGIGGILSYSLKNHCQETPAFSAIQQDALNSVEFIPFIKVEWRKIGGAVLVLALFIVSYTYIFIFLPLIHSDQIDSESFDTFKSLIVYGVCLVVAGFIADYISVKKTIMFGAALLSFTILPLSYFCHHLLTLQVTLTIFACLAIGPIHSWLLDQFPSHGRCRGIFISSAIATSLFSGSTVPICLGLFEVTQSLAVCSLYPFTIFILAFIYLLNPLGLRPKVSR